MKISKNYEMHFAVLVLAALGVYLVLQSAFMPFSRDGVISTDTGVWLQIAREMSEGRMVYRDLFDHKGPLLFLLYSLFFRAGGTTGVWLLQCLLLAVTITAAYWCVRKLVANRIAAAYAVMGAVLGKNIFGGEDFPIEEAALPFLMLSLFVFVSYLCDDKRTIRPKEIVLLGLCMGSVLCLRPNLIALWTVFVPAVFLEGVCAKRYKEMLLCAGCFTAGAAAVIALLCVWLQCGGALSACWEEAVRFNFLYVGKSDSLSRIRVFLEFFFHPLQFACICLNLYLFLRKKELRLLYGSNLLYILLNLILASMSGVNYRNYEIALIPGFVLPLAGGIGDLWNFLERRKGRRGFLSPFCVITLILFLLYGNGGGFYGLKKIYYNVQITGAERENLEMMRFIEENTAEEEKITVLGNVAYIYLGTGRCSATEFIYTYPVCEMSGELGGRFLEQMETAEPPFIVVKEGWFEEPVPFRKKIETLIEKNYVNVMETGDFIVYERL